MQDNVISTADASCIFVYT